MRFEFDSQKSELNKTKHGIDFIAAQQLWEDLNRVVVPARTSDEPRYLLISRVSGKHWSAVFTLRGEAVRIISVRRSVLRRLKFMKAKEFDKKFDSGESIVQYLELERTARPGQEQRRSMWISRPG